MQPLDLIRHPIVFISIAFQDFLHWYFLEKPVKILRTYRAYFLACNEICSFGFLLRTLFAPWKQITEKYPPHGIDLSRIAQAFTLNVTTRVIGFIIRTVSLLLGVLIQLALLVGFLGFLIAWIAFPVLFVLGVLYILGALSL